MAFITYSTSLDSWAVIHSKQEHYYRLLLAPPLEMYSEICSTKLGLLGHMLK